MKSEIRNPKSKILKALFAEAKRLGIDQETLRDDITPGVINKRLSEASPQEIAQVLVYVHNRHGIPDQHSQAELGNEKRYESSRAGLLEEIRDLAIARFGEDYALPLNAFCARFGEPDGFRKMRVNQMKIIKQRLKELQREDPRNLSPNALIGDPGQETLNTKPVVSAVEPQETQNTKVIIFHKGRKGFLNQLGELDNI